VGLKTKQTKQTKQTIDNLAASLAKHSLSMDNLVKCTVMLADIKDWPAFNQVYKGYFPARNAFDTNGLAINSRVEMECIEAVKGQ
jgi:enamine deaminase RidA (YjgF/YER057c/UK114 family)